MDDLNVISGEELTRRVPDLKIKDQLEPYVLSTRPWLIEMEHPIGETLDNDMFARQAIMSALTSSVGVCMVISAVVAANVTTVHAFYPTTEKVTDEEVKAAIAVHQAEAPFYTMTHVPGYRFKLLTHELNFPPYTLVGILVVHRTKIEEFGTLNPKTWLRILTRL